MDQNLKDWVLQHPKDMQENALKEAIQNYVLDGLSQTDFFSQLKRYPDYQSMEPTLANAKLLLARRFQEVSIERVQPDVKRFLPLAEQQKIASWSTPYFVQLTETLQAISYPQSRERLVSFAGSSSATDVSHGNSPQSKSEKQPPKPKEK